jgi:hypothetical protein
VLELVPPGKDLPYNISIGLILGFPLGAAVVKIRASIRSLNQFS